MQHFHTRSLKEMEDYLMALRYSYYIKATPIVTDETYDALERIFRKTHPDADSPINRPGSDLEESYGPAYRALALQLSSSLQKKEKRIVHPDRAASA